MCAALCSRVSFRMLKASPMGSAALTTSRSILGMAARRRASERLFVTRPSFELSKWYFDCVAPDGRTFIGYAGDLRWKALSLHYQSSLLRSEVEGTRARFSLRKRSEEHTSELQSPTN